MSVTDEATRQSQRRRSAVLWRVVAAVAACCLVLLTASYLLLIPHSLLGIAPWWLVLDVLLVGLTGFACGNDVVVARRTRSLRRAEVVAVVAAGVLVVLWIAGLLVLPVLPDGRFVLLRVLVVIPLLPVAGLAWLGAFVRRSFPLSASVS
jgi:hypothetical protein